MLSVFVVKLLIQLIRSEPFVCDLHHVKQYYNYTMSVYFTRLVPSAKLNNIMLYLIHFDTDNIRVTCNKSHDIVRR
jgi:hypothetical protein